MGVRETWSELGTGAKILIGAVVGGVVLVVGIVLLLVLAAVVGAFALDLGESSGQASPQASFAAEYDAGDETVDVTHDGGDAIRATALTVEVGDRAHQWEDDDGSVTAGDSMVVEATPGTTVRVVWTDGDESTVLFRGTTE